MAALTFTKEGNIYVATFTSTGETVVQMERKENTPISVCANLEDMTPVPVMDVRNGYGANAIFTVDLPADVEVTIKSASEVISANILEVI